MRLIIRNRQIKPITVITAFTCFLMLIPGLWMLAEVYQTKVFMVEKVDRFEELLRNEDYNEARIILDYALQNLSGVKKDQALDQIEKALDLSLEDIVDQIPDKKSDAKLLQRLQGLNRFRKEFAGQVDVELQKLTNFYLHRKIDYATVSYYFNNLKALDLFRENLDKYEMIISAEELSRKYNYQEAYRMLERILQVYPDDGLLISKISEYKEAEQQLVVYEGPIEHIFFHPLIAYPELAFDNDSLAQGYNDYFVTVKEFHKILESLYGNNFILVDINSIFEEQVGHREKVLTKKELLLPKDKKPLIISIDDLNYYDYMLKNGNVHKLVLDQEGNIATLSVLPTGEEITAYDNEIIPILDEFVKKHPDFSFQGAKGVIALTGYQGILGYRTNELNSPDFETEKKNALRVIKRLKETGWSFASHGYGHRDTKKISYSLLVKDTEHWKKEVESLIGPTNVYIYPYGSKVLPKDAKYRYLVEAGFNVFASIGPTPYLKFARDSLMMDRRHIDGLAFKYQRSRLQDLFDSSKIIDSARLF